MNLKQLTTILLSVILYANLTGQQQYISKNINYTKDTTSIYIDDAINAKELNITSKTVEWVIKLPYSNLNSLDSIATKNPIYNIASFKMYSECNSLMWECSANNNLLVDCMKRNIKSQTEALKKIENTACLNKFWLEVKIKKGDTIFSVPIVIEVF